MNSKLSKILTIIVAVISVIGIALFINVSITDDVPVSNPLELFFSRWIAARRASVQSA